MTFSLISNASSSNSHLLLGTGNRCADYGSLGATNPISVNSQVLSRVIQLRAAQLEASPNSRIDRRPPEVDDTMAEILAIPGKEDIPDGQYVGEVKKGQPHGRGIATYKRDPKKRNWKRYEGHWENGKFHGLGLLILRNGATYDGKWQAGLLHGRAASFEADRFQTRYEGEYVQGKKQGYGKLTLVNGKCGMYEGEWQEDQFHGHGRLVNLFEEVYEGDFVKSSISGRGKIIWPYGDIYEGECLSFYIEEYTHWPSIGSAPHGEGTMKRCNSVLKGLWKKGILWSGTHLNGKKRYTVIEGIEWFGNQKIDGVHESYKCCCCKMQ